jgi:hypothetical protein
MNTDRDTQSISDTVAERHESTFKHGAVVHAGQISESDFDGTANLTIGKATVLIPAPTADPRGETIENKFGK